MNCFNYVIIVNTTMLFIEYFELYVSIIYTIYISISIIYIYNTYYVLLIQQCYLSNVFKSHKNRTE